MPHSHHSHSGQFCRHAKDSLSAVVDEAVRKGFEVFGLSEHAPRYREQDMFPEEADLTPEDLWTAYEDFLVEAQRIRDSRKDIQLLLGVETDYISELDSEGLERLLAAHPEIDYIVGSVHHVNGVSIDFDRPTWLRSVRQARSAEAGATVTRVNGELQLVPSDDDPALARTYTPSRKELEPFLAAYLDAQYAMLQRHQPEVVGHFDLCLLWTQGASLSAMPAVWERVGRNIEYAVGYGALFEANAAAIRKGWRTSYPSPDVLNMILRRGGRICLSDDSHGVALVGLNYAKMRDYLAGQGVQTVWFLVPEAHKREGDEKVGPRGRVVARPMKDWAEHEFWDKLAAAEQ